MTNKQNTTSSHLNKVLMMISQVFEQRYSKKQMQTGSRLFNEAKQNSDYDILALVKDDVTILSITEEIRVLISDVGRMLKINTPSILLTTGCGYNTITENIGISIKLKYDNQVLNFIVFENERIYEQWAFATKAYTHLRGIIPASKTTDRDIRVAIFTRLCDIMIDEQDRLLYDGGDTK
jgi:predicted nucleotidyltransferase